MNNKINQFTANLDNKSGCKSLARRNFLQKLAVCTGVTIGTSPLFSILGNAHAADTVSENDPHIEAFMMEIPSSLGTLQAYMALPANTKERLPAVLIIHENKGLDAHIKDITRRLANAGYLAMATDYLSHKGGTPEDKEKARTMIRDIPAPVALGISDAGFRYLMVNMKCNGKVAVLGFAWGGGQASALAVNEPSLKAAINYYGYYPKTNDEVAKITAPLLLHYAGLDNNSANIEAFETALKANHKTYTSYKYEGVKQSFSNETNPERYNKEAAELAWKRSLDFLKEQLGSK